MELSEQNAAEHGENKHVVCATGIKVRLGFRTWCRWDPNGNFIGTLHCHRNGKLKFLVQFIHGTLDCARFYHANSIVVASPLIIVGRNEQRKKKKKKTGNQLSTKNTGYSSYKAACAASDSWCTHSVFSYSFKSGDQASYSDLQPEECTSIDPLKLAPCIKELEAW